MRFTFIRELLRRERLLLLSIRPGGVDECEHPFKEVVYKAARVAFILLVVMSYRRIQGALKALLQ